MGCEAAPLFEGPAALIAACGSGYSIALLPALRCHFIAHPPFHPARAVSGLFFLPERRAGFQVVHHKRTGIERRLAMGTGHPHKHDRLTRIPRTQTV